MYHNSGVTPLGIALLSLTAALSPTWTGPSESPSADDAGVLRTLTGTVSDSICKGRGIYKAQTRMSCTLLCVDTKGADYVLVVGDSVYVLEGHRGQLREFAGGPATVTGRVNGNALVVESVAKTHK